MGMRVDTGRRFEYLDDEERELAESVENGEWEPVEDIERAKERAVRYAAATLQRLSATSVPIASPDGNLDWKAFSESFPRLFPERYELPRDYLISKSA